MIARERPILMSAPMVRALLSGAKTKTRRIAKGAPHHDFEAEAVMVHGQACFGRRGQAGTTAETFHFFMGEEGELPALACPYGVPGDRLWVRESCRAEELSRPPQTRAATRLERERLGRTTMIELDEMDGIDGVRYAADDAWAKIENTPEAGEKWSALYHYSGRGKAGIGNQVPSIHMPRWASRLTLEITDVRVERLRDISEADAEAEGIREPSLGDLHLIDRGAASSVARAKAPPLVLWEFLWKRVNGDSSWDANPWVWAISFKAAP